MFRTIFIVLAFVSMASINSVVLAEPTAPAQAATTAEPIAAEPCAISEFFKCAVGEWVGVCKQSTDDESTDDKYFHAVIKKNDSGAYEANFEYYRLGATGTLTEIGSSTVTATITSDCVATTKIAGKGEMLVDRKPKKQEHNLEECLTAAGPGAIEARGTGSLQVYGMPLGLGKLGKVRDDRSSWSLSNDKLTIHQNLSIVFRALCFSKSYRVDATYSAVRGSDVSSQIPSQETTVSKIGG